MKIGLVSIFVSDPVAAFRFYTSVLGFKEKLFQPEHWLAIVVSAEGPEGTALLLEPNHNKIARSYQNALWKAALPCMVFDTADIESEYQQLKSLNVVFRKPPTKTAYGIEAVFEDGFGNLIQLQQV